MRTTRTLRAPKVLTTRTNTALKVKSLKGAVSVAKFKNPPK